METPTAPATAGTIPAVNPQAALQTMLDGLGLQTKVEQYTVDGTMLLHIATADPGRLIGRGGQTINSLQFLLNRIIQRGNPDAPRVTVDCERYRERQRDDLLKSVMEAAEKVRRWGEPVHVGPFSAFDRRTIHRYLERDAELEVVSEEGDETGSKKMIVRIKEKPAA
jgi:spoIIIJ-associated protein